MGSMDRLLAEIELDFLHTGARTGCLTLDPEVRRALREVPREQFVPAGLRDQSHQNRPLPIGEGQTISQPFIVALMTQLLGIDSHSRVLEIGTGSGYQTAVLATLAGEVYSIEAIAALGLTARERLAPWDNVHLKTGDGALGWPEAAPFDAILVTAAAARLPETLVTQLADSAPLVVPIGRPMGRQVLCRFRRDADGVVQKEELLDVAFVPLVSDRLSA